MHEKKKIQKTWKAWIFCYIFYLSLIIIFLFFVIFWGSVWMRCSLHTLIHIYFERININTKKRETRQNKILLSSKNSVEKKGRKFTLFRQIFFFEDWKTGQRGVGNQIFWIFETFPRFIKPSINFRANQRIQVFLWRIKLEKCWPT